MAYVQDRIKTTYAYFGSSIVFTVAAAAAFPPAIMNLMMRTHGSSLEEVWLL
jgi:hypothetical protein